MSIRCRLFRLRPDISPVGKASRRVGSAERRAARLHGNANGGGLHPPRRRGFGGRRFDGPRRAVGILLVRYRLHGFRRLARTLGTQGFGFVTRQELRSLFAHHRRPVAGSEADDQRDFLLLLPGRVPGNPHAVRVADVRAAVVLGQLFGGEDVLSVGPRVGLVAALFVEGVDHQRAVDLDRLLLLAGVEHQPSAKASHRFAASAVEDGVGPHGYHLGGRAGGDVVAVAPRDILVQIELRAAARQQQGCAEGNRHHPFPLSRCGRGGGLNC